MKYLAGNTAAVTAIAPSSRIAPGILPNGTTLPAVEIESVSGVPRTTIAMTEPGRLHSERVQLRGIVQRLGNGSGADYAQLVTLMKALARIPNTRGTIAGISVDSVIVDIEGPDDNDVDAGRIARTRDYIVKWKET